MMEVLGNPPQPSRWEVREPTTQAEAVSLLRGAVVVMHQQLEYQRGKRKKAWDGDYVEHLWGESLRALKFLEANAKPDDFEPVT